MGYKIVLDSGGEMTESMRKSGKVEMVPLILEIGEETIVDNGILSQIDIVNRIAQAKDCPKTACPSPETYRQACDCDAERVYVVTLSAKLSGSYQSAMTGKMMLEEERDDIQVYVFNSRSASIGETLIALKIEELEEQGLGFEEVVKETEAYIDEMRTFFVVDNLETLRKNGRLSLLKCAAATFLKIKPICASTPDGEIEQIDQARGIKRAMEKMADYATHHGRDKNNRLGISFVNCRERAEGLKGVILEKLKVKDTLVEETGGLSTVYANDGGVIMVI
ncbi:MAG: DegV family protein [Lachnospiraceae bacterium]|nr:DegV family protein [Candidatus Equihabitans merdae]